MREADFQPVQIRPIDLSQDSIGELTDLLHRAYKPLDDMGLKFSATRQDDNVTLERIQDGKCFVAVYDGCLVGTITYYFPVLARHKRTPWLERPGVAVFAQFAVEPAFQQRGIGGRLIDMVEEAAKTDGATEMALSTAAPAEHLIRYYAARGYRYIEIGDFTLPRYRSVVMSKTL